MSLDSGIDISGTMSLLSRKGDHENGEVGVPSQCDEFAKLCSEGFQGGDRGESGDADSEVPSDIANGPSSKSSSSKSL